jgi:hypothetical protein
MDYVAPDPNGFTLQPVTTINCSYRGLLDLPEKLPSATTTLLVKGNQVQARTHAKTFLLLFYYGNQD